MVRALFSAMLALLFTPILLATATAAPAAMGPTAMGSAMARPAAMSPGMGPATAMDPGMASTAATKPGDGNGSEEPPADAEPLPPEQRPYRSIRLEANDILWLEPGQQGLIEAHPLVMGLAAMALATVTLLFFFLRGVKRPRDRDL